MKVGYARCSSEDQNPARQEKILMDSGCEKVFLDMLSGKDRNRPGLEDMLSFIREGDTVYVESISRLARSTKDLLNIVDEIKDKGALFVSEKEKIDTDTPQGKFMLTVFAALSELEREQIRERQAEGIAIAKRNGKYTGRQPIHYDHYLFEQLYRQWKAGEVTQKYMCKKLNMSRTTLSRRITDYEHSSTLKTKQMIDSLGHEYDQVSLF